jgi:hypothetical protein
MNAELRRYVWLELTTFRLIATPIIVAIVVFLIVASAGQKPWDTVASASLAAFSLSVFIVGSARAFASVTEEVRDRTWDFQRMSALPPWSLAVGKIVGAPLFMSYIGLCCMLAFLLAATQADVARPVLTLVTYFAAAVLLHGLAVALSAALARSTLSPRARRGLPVVVGLLVLLSFIPSLAFRVFVDKDGEQGLGMLRWFVFGPISIEFFSALTLIAFAAWAVFAAWRAMARELREQAWWWAWPLFSGFVWLWFAGVGHASLHDKLDPSAAAASFAVCLLVAACYLQFFLDPLTRVSLARLSHSGAIAQDKPWHQRVPHWAIHGAIALVAAAMAAIMGGGVQMPKRGAFDGTVPIALTVALPLALMFIRDAAIVSCFALSTRMKRPVGAAVFFVLALDLLLPWILNAVELSTLALWAFPFFNDPRSDWPLAALGFAAHAALALTVLWWLRFRAGSVQGNPSV